MMRHTRHHTRCLLLAAASMMVATMGGWGAAGHRAITRAAIQALPPDMPAWIKDPAIVDRASFLANEPDRWRATRIDALTHENGPDHYIDLEELEPRGMSLRTLPPLRYEFVMKLERSKPGKAEPGDGAEAPRRGITRFATDEVGMIPYAIAEHHAKLASAFRTLRILDTVNDPARAVEREATLASIASEMGHLSHFVGDATQPLHTTVHHHGWVGENPEGYTTDSGIHSRIDSGVVEHHGINTDAIVSAMGAADEGPAAGGTWEASLSLIERSFAQVEPLYQLEKRGVLEGEEGKVFITERMADGARTLASLYHSAWLASEPTPQQIETFVEYDETGR